MRLSGTESLSIELAAQLPRTATDAQRVPAPLEVARDASGRGHVSVLVLEMKGLGLGPLPPRFDYREVLYRLGVVIDGAPGWLALRCDIDRALVRRMAASIIRYPVRRAEIAIEQPDARTVTFSARTDTDHLAATLEVSPAESMPAAVPPARTFVVDDGALYEVPWDERPAPVRARAQVKGPAGGAAVFGEAIAFDSALIHRGRVHFCGAAGIVKPLF